MVNLILKLLEKIGTLFLMLAAFLVLGSMPITLLGLCLVGILSLFTDEDYTQICFIISFLIVVLYCILQDKLDEYKEKHRKEVDKQPKERKGTYIDSWHEKYINDKKIMDNENKRYQKEQQEEVEKILSYRDNIRHASQQNYVSLNMDKSFARYTKKDIDNINDWRKFEQFVAKQFKRKNFKVILTPRTNDGGKDIIIDKNGIKTYVECKYWNSNKSIGREEIQKLAGAAMMDGVRNALFITTSTYNKNAFETAKALNKNGFNIKLWTTNDLLVFINE